MAARQIFEQPSAPFPTSPSSLDAVPQSDYDPDAVDDVPPSSASEDDRSADSSPKKKSKPARAKRRVPCFGGHSVEEAGSSLWLPVTVLLLFRLAVAAMLIGHAVFYLLTGAFSFRLYATWAYLGLSVTFLAAVTCSLLDLLRDEDEEDVPVSDEEEGGRPADVLLGQEPRDTGFAYFVAQVTVPLYQIFVTVTLFGAIVFWAAILPEQSADVDYPLLALNTIAPGVVVVDLLLSLSMHFRLAYIPLVVLFNAAYAAALFAFYKLEDIYVYNFLNPSQPKGEFVAKAVGLAVASVIAPLFMYALSIFRDLIVRRRERKNDKAEKAEVKSVSDKEGGNSSEDTSDSSQGVQIVAERAVSANKIEESSHEFDIDEVVVAESDEERSVFSAGSIDRRDRSSVPLSKRPSNLNTAGSNKRWYRTSTSGRMQMSMSGSTLGEDIESRTVSQWGELELDGVHARPEDEYFTMPAAYNGGKQEVLKLTPILRSDSGPGRQFARSVSGRQLFRSGSGRQFVQSSSGRALARAPSDSGIRRSGSGSRPSERWSDPRTREQTEARK